MYTFTCEHGGNLIPKEFKYLFKAHHSLLNSHRAYDLGILELFKSFTKQFNFSCYYSETSRLLVELNRSLHHKNLFSEVTKQLNEETKQSIIDKCYLPYRNDVERAIHDLIKKNYKVIHISFHSFTPELNGVTRNADIGLLYDPRSNNEKEFCKRWKERIFIIDSNLRVRFNYPYLGIADGFTSFLRKKFGYKYYSGIELEINQKLLTNKNNSIIISKVITSSFKNILNESLDQSF